MRKTLLLRKQLVTITMATKRHHAAISEAQVVGGRKEAADLGVGRKEADLGVERKEADLEVERKEAVLEEFASGKAVEAVVSTEEEASGKEKVSLEVAERKVGASDL